MLPPRKRRVVVAAASRSCERAPAGPLPSGGRIFVEEPMSEVWKDIPGYEGRYQVSDAGRVRSLKTGRGLVLATVSGGYAAVSLGKNASRTVHRLVALAFLGPAPEDKPLVLHRDGDRKNNLLSNLRYGSHYDNISDARRHGTLVRGERQGAAKLTADIVRHIRSSDASGAALGRLYGVTTAAICAVRKRKNWKHV